MQRIAQVKKKMKAAKRLQQIQNKKKGKKDKKKIANKKKKEKENWNSIKFYLQLMQFSNFSYPKI